MSDNDAAQLIAAGVIVLLTLTLSIVRRRVPVVATDSVTYTPAGGTERTLFKGSRVPAGEVSAAKQMDEASVKVVRQSALYAIVVGKDHRASTSKTVAFAWTLAIGFGLLSRR
jgi:hypothetical protein